MQKLFNLLFDENYVILFYRNNFSIYLIILISGLDTLVLGKILNILFSYYDWLIYWLDNVLRRIGMENISTI